MEEPKSFLLYRSIITIPWNERALILMASDFTHTLDGTKRIERGKESYLQ